MSIFVFDAYGTLFDVHAAIARFRGPAGPDADRMSEIWRGKQLEYTWTLTLAGHYVDFWTLTERALDYSLARVPSVDKALKPKLLEAYFQLDAFPDARAALRALKQAGKKNRHSLQRLAQHAQGCRGCRRHRRRSRRRAVGGRSEDVQAAAGGLRPRDGSLQMRSRRRDFRVSTAGT
jgi:HAD superfamily hydrolase (TIGR01493 family)